MGKRVVDDASLTAVADAIRANTGKNELLKIADMAAEVDGVYEKGVADTHAAYLLKTLTEIKFPNGLTTIEDNLYQDQIGLKGKIVFPDSVTTVGNRAFDGCSKITEVHGQGVKSIGSYTFYRLTNMTVFDCPNLTTIGTYAFQNCEKIKEFVFPKLTTLSGNLFMFCYALTKVDFHALTNIDAQGFRNAKALKTVAIRTLSVCTVDNINAFNSCDNIVTGTCYFYVPRNLVDSYKTATHWSTYANQIRALEDYTVDGTTTGELDPNKI